MSDEDARDRTVRDALDELVAALIEGTRQGKLDWEPMTDGATQYQIELESGAAVAIDSRDDDGAAPYDLYVFARDGQISDQRRWTLRPGEGTADAERNRQLRQLYEMARRRATGADQLLRSVLDEVKKTVAEGKRD